MEQQYYKEAKPGEMAMRRCGCYFEYCDGCCNSCDKTNQQASSTTSIKLDQSITSDRTYPDAFYLYKNKLEG